MSKFSSEGKIFDPIKLKADLRDTYIELLSAQCAVNRLNMRYPMQALAEHGGELLPRTIEFAESIQRFFAEIKGMMAGTSWPSSKQGNQQQPN